MTRYALALGLAAISCRCTSDPAAVAASTSTAGTTVSQPPASGRNAAGTNPQGIAGSTARDAGTAPPAPRDASVTPPPPAAGQPAASSGTAPTAGTAGTAPTAGTGAAAGSGSPAPGACNAQLCESFEAPGATTLDPMRWEVVSTDCMGTGKAALDSTQAHSGTHSVRIDGTAGYCNHVFVRPRAELFKPSDPVYGRFYLRMSTAFGAGHVTLMALHDDNDKNDLRMGGQSQILMWNRQSDDATLPELSPTGIAMSTMPAINTWLCVEFMVDGKTPQLQTWVNGQPVVGLTVEGAPTPDVDSQWQRKTDWHPQLSDVRFGWESYGGDANTLWFDDIALGTTRIGCLP